MVREAQDEIDDSGFGEKARPEDGELIEGVYGVTFILMIPGYGEDEVRVVASKDAVGVEAGGFMTVRPLHCRVDPSSLKTSYRNGVLSARLSRAF